MAIDRRRLTRCQPICPSCDTGARPFGTSWARSVLVRITNAEYLLLDSHGRWERGRAALISRKAWSRTRQYKELKATIRHESPLCAACGTTPADSIDHIWPLILGGTHDPSNLRLLCGPCNSAKGAKV